jgi:hypothetical protein
MSWSAPGSLMVGKAFRTISTTTTRGLLNWNATHDCYTGGAINTLMNDWYEPNCT